MVGKKEAAEYLGVSTRTLERYAKDGKLSIRYEPSLNGEVAKFDEDELENLKEGRQIVRVQPATTIDNNPKIQSSEIVPSTPPSFTAGLMSPLTTLVERLIHALTDRDAKTTPAMLQGKLLLNLAEAQILTGLSRDILMTAIKNQELPSQIMGKAYRIKHKDLEKFIDELWS
jgi:excisionase family DNA binding protein